MRIETTVTDAATGAAVDPDSVVVKLRNPSTGATASHTATRQSAGHYRYDAIASQPGTWRYRIETTGSIVSAIEGAYVVQATGV